MKSFNLHAVQPNAEVQKVLDLLVSWNLPQLCSKFKEEQICENALRCLNAAEILELVPKIGPRAIFRTQLHKWKMDNPPEKHAETLSDDFEEQPALPMLIKAEHEFDMDILTVKLDNESEDQHSNETASSSDDDMDSANYRGALDILNVHNIIHTSSEGQKTLKFYDKHKYLDSQMRRLCVQAIVNVAIEKKVRMAPIVLQKLAQQLVSVFPSEHVETYYEPRQGPINPRGILHHKYFNTCRRLRLQSETDVRPKVRRLLS